MSTNKQNARLVRRLDRLFVEALTAKTRAMQYPGFTSGRKATERCDRACGEFDATLIQLLANLGEPIEPDDEPMP